MLAEELRWRGDAEKLIEAMLKAEVLLRDDAGTLVAKNFPKRQGTLIKKLLSERVPEELKGKSRTKEGAGKTGDNTVVSVLMQRMREAHITGSVDQKREHAEAWCATGRSQQAEALIMGEGKGKGIFWLAKVLDGAPAQSNNGEAPGPLVDIGKFFGEKKK